MKKLEGKYPGRFDEINHEIPKAENYIFSFEAKGVTLLFQEIVCKAYSPFGSVLLCVDGTVRSFISKTTVEKMYKTGEKFFSNADNIKKTAQALEILIDRANHISEKYRNLNDITKEDVQEAFLLMEQIHEEYSRFDSFYSDGAYNKYGELNEALKLVDFYKNDIREKYNDLFFVYDGGFVTLLVAISQKVNVPVPDLVWCLEDEIIGLIQGETLDRKVIESRKKKYVFNKDSEGEIYFFEENQASIFIDYFQDVAPKSEKQIKGQTANSTGEIVRGQVVIINSDYFDVEVVQQKMKKMQKGQVLVAVTTAPDLMMALKKASAVVTDVGGMLSHAAITARELNIPCIVGTKFASQILKDGDLVEIDADQGTVKII